jgi:hypothetical protein
MQNNTAVIEILPNILLMTDGYIINNIVLNSFEK